NGLKVVLLPDNEQDGLFVVCQLPFGKLCDTYGLEGLSEITLNLLQKGTVNYTAEAIAEKLENMGASMVSDMGEEYTRIGVRMLSKFEDEIFRVFWEMICKPAFDKGEYNRLIREMITGLKTELIDPQTIAEHHFCNQLASSEHPVGRDITKQSLKKIKLADIAAYYKERFIPQGCTLVVAGNFVPSEFKQKWNSLLLEWKKCGKSSVFKVPPFKPASRVIRLVDNPNLTQTTIVAGHFVGGESYQFKNEISLANYVLGGGNFSSRLMAKIRSVCGKTYGVNSQIVSTLDFGVFRMVTSTQNNHVGEVMSIIMDVFREFCEQGISEDELEKAKKFVIGNMSFQFEGIMNLVEKILWLRYIDRPYTYLESFNESISGITLDAVNSAERAFHQKNLSLLQLVKKLKWRMI
ncbi:MAG: pitrilysin family protein, partial [Fibrobacter sp.]|nr:pitrilysin family protein [Fibrobacter sp.]